MITSSSTGNAQQMHDKALADTLDALHTNCPTLNLDKCKVNLLSIEYYGIIFSETGVSPDPNKVQALKELPPPSNVAKLRSVQGMMNYLSRFIKDCHHQRTHETPHQEGCRLAMVKRTRRGVYRAQRLAHRRYLCCLI